MQAAVDVVIKDPVGSVKKAATPEGRDFYALSALTMTVQTPTLWPLLRDAGILNVFIELLVDEWTSKDVEAVRSSVYWHMQLCWTTDLCSTLICDLDCSWMGVLVDWNHQCPRFSKKG